MGFLLAEFRFMGGYVQAEEDRVVECFAAVQARVFADGAAGGEEFVAAGFVRCGLVVLGFEAFCSVD